MRTVDPLQPISDEQLPELLAELAEAARADRRTAGRFVPPRIGILEETAARRHQFVLGRRGVGKSTLLRKIESLGDEAKNVIVFVDIETLRDRPYPDVLIEMLIELLAGLRDRLKPEAWYRIDRRVARSRVRRRLAKLTATLRRLLAQPQVGQRNRARAAVARHARVRWRAPRTPLSRTACRGGGGREPHERESRELGRQ